MTNGFIISSQNHLIEKKNSCILFHVNFIMMHSEMALKTFLIYFAPFLVGSVAIFAVTRQFSVGLSAKEKSPFLYGVIAAVLAAGLAFLITYLTSDLFTLFWVFSAIFLLFGVIHILITNKRYFNHPRETKTRQVSAEFLFALTVVALCVAFFGALQYFLRDKSFLFYPLLFSFLFFFIPLLVFHSFKAAYEIPPPVFTTWEYPLGKAIELPDEKENETVYVIGFELAKNGGNEHRTYFRAKAPAEMKLGELYYHFINDYNEQQSETPIRYERKDGEPENWFFRTKPKWYTSSRMLDPYKTVDENEIKENSVIICERAS
jgi:hypothetical protein